VFNISEDTFTVEAGEKFVFEVNQAEDVTIEADASKDLGNYITANHEEIIINVPETFRGIYKVEFKVIDSDKNDNNNSFLLRVKPPSIGEKEDKKDEQEYEPVSENKEYYLSVWQENQRLVDLEKKLDNNNSIIIGKSSSLTKNPDIDLRDYFKDEKNIENCSRHQLRIFITRNKYITVKNIGTNTVKYDEKKLKPNDKVIWEKNINFVIANEFIIKLEER